MKRGQRLIDGKVYILSGRCGSKLQANAEADLMRKRGLQVRIIKLNTFDYLIYAI